MGKEPYNHPPKKTRPKRHEERRCKVVGHKVNFFRPRVNELAFTSGVLEGSTPHEKKPVPETNSSPLENPRHFDGIYQERWGFSWAMLVSGRV